MAEAYLREEHGHHHRTHGPSSASSSGGFGKFSSHGAPTAAAVPPAQVAIPVGFGVPAVKVSII